MVERVFERRRRADDELPIPDLRRLGAFVRAERIRAGVSQEELAERAEIEQATLSRWEHGQIRRVPDGAVLRRVASALGVEELALLRTVGYLPEGVVSELGDAPDVQFAYTLLMRRIDDDGALSAAEKAVLRDQVQMTRRLHAMLGEE